MHKSAQIHILSTTASRHATFHTGDPSILTYRAEPSSGRKGRQFSPEKFPSFRSDTAAYTFCIQKKFLDRRSFPNETKVSPLWIRFHSDLVLRHLNVRAFVYVCVRERSSDFSVQFASCKLKKPNSLNWKFETLSRHTEPVPFENTVPARLTRHWNQL